MGVLPNFMSLKILEGFVLFPLKHKNLRAKFPNFAGTVLMVSMFDGKAKNDKWSVSPAPTDDDLGNFSFCKRKQNQQQREHGAFRAVLN